MDCYCIVRTGAGSFLYTKRLYSSEIKSLRKQGYIVEEI